MVDEKTLDCMLATQLWMHYEEAIADIIAANQRTPRMPNKGLLQRDEIELKEANLMLQKITPSVIECVGTANPAAAPAISDISKDINSAVDGMLADLIPVAVDGMVRARLKLGELTNTLISPPAKVPELPAPTINR
jgi:hypothetical protein